ncbi:MAG: tRNA (guanosine(37)-N1)-methyltransferase TrmD [Verrucomicrobiota bacterium]
MTPALEIELLTLFPGMLRGILDESILGRAVDRGLIELRTHNIRDYSSDKHHTTDDRPFGGGAGMVMKPDPIFKAFDAISRPDSYALYMSPDGIPLTSDWVRSTISGKNAKKHLIILSGHYEGVDQRVRDTLIDQEVSIGDYILTNGTLAAAVVADALCRYIPGVLGEENSLTQDAFNDNLLSFPQYTRPAMYREMGVPDVLMSGDHAKIAAWRRQQREEKTRKLRPDLF